MKHTKSFFISAFVAAAMVTGVFCAPVYAEPTTTPTPVNGTDEKPPTPNKPKCSVLPEFICGAADKDKATAQESGVMMMLVWALNILTAIVGVVAVGAIVYAGILYTSAGGGNEQVVKAKKIITDVVIGIIAYGVMYLALNWLIPGGVIG